MVATIMLPTAAAAASGGPVGPPPVGQPGTVTGQVTNALTGGGLDGALVTADDGSSTLTAAGGFYSLPGLSAGSHQLTASFEGFGSQDAVVTVPAGDTVTENFALTETTGKIATFVLSWGDSPRDLDLHLSGPADNDGNRFHCWYDDRNPTSFISQDVDDTDGDGPETDSVAISASEGYVPGDYHLWVQDYSGRYDGDVSFIGSGAKVVISDTSGANTSFLVSQVSDNDNDGDIWRIADFTLDATGLMTVTNVYQTFITGEDSTVY